MPAPGLDGPSQRNAASAAGARMARLVAHLPDAAAVEQVFGDGEALSIGRAAGNGFCLPHPSVSRTHATLEPGADGWRLHDLGSRNGSFVDGVAPGEGRVVPRSAWLRFGDVHCEFTELDPAQAQANRARTQARRAAATAHTARIDGVRGLDELLDASLHGVLDLAQCERGFVLLRDGDGFAVRNSISLDPAQLRARDFSGSVGAVRRALDERRSVIANDIGGDAWLSARASVVAGGLSALVCLPLFDGERALGAIYADRTRAAAPITRLDQELLEAFAERAALWIAARRASELLDARDDAPPDWGAILAVHQDARP